MDVINANTKIASILKQHPGALEAIISISPKFNKLRNPLMRKLIASRASIFMASKMGGCTVDDFFKKLQPLGFSIDNTAAVEENAEMKELPGFMRNISEGAIVELDVRSVLDGGEDPLKLILEKTKQLKTQQILKLVNSFEPIPLIQLLEKQGYETFSETINDNLVYTYFFKSENSASPEPQLNNTAGDWENVLAQFEGKTKDVDVRALEMPLPMLTILDEMDKLPAGHCLFVYHKRIPVFLLPELKERKFEYRINEITDGEVHLLIFRH
ncbi:MAG: DUF2249 domain-containing protein [Crocinitomicaceae bacterium]|nr:DUF2249 domain-containing protein [Crocinitomicaceae bacterium]